MIGCTETRSILFFFSFVSFVGPYSRILDVCLSRARNFLALSLYASAELTLPMELFSGLMMLFVLYLASLFLRLYRRRLSIFPSFFFPFSGGLICVDSHSLYFSSCSLSVSFSTELIPKPAQPCDAPPLYLRLRMGKPLNRKGAMTTPIMSYGKKKMKPEYWFSIPRDKYNLRILPSTLIPNVTHSMSTLYC